VLNEHKKEDSLVFSSLTVITPSNKKYRYGCIDIWYLAGDDGSVTAMLRSVFKNIKRS
jgi:hypothetical protein